MAKTYDIHALFMTLSDSADGHGAERLRRDLDRLDLDLDRGRVTPATLLSRAGYSHAYVGLLMRARIRHFHEGRPHATIEPCKDS